MLIALALSLLLLPSLGRDAWAQAEPLPAPSPTAAPAGAAAGHDAPSDVLLLEELVVHAPGKREESIQETAGSVSAFSNADLQDFRIQGFEDTLRLVPNTFVEERTNGDVAVSIRGVGNQGTNNVDTGVAFYVDGVYDYAQGTQNNLAMYDIDRLEVLRGPQGSLYGRNAVGGALVIETARPVDAMLGHVGAEFGNYASRRVEAMVNVPIVEDRLLIRAAGLYNARDSYFFNETLQRDERGVDQLSGRVWLRALPLDGLRVDVGYESTDEDLPGLLLTPASAGNRRITTTNTRGFNDQRETRWVGDVLYEGLSSLDLRSITGWIDSRATTLLDFDNGPGLNSTSLQRLPGDQLTQEIRATSKPSSGPFDWIAGFNYFRDRADGSQDNSIDVGGGNAILQDQTIDAGIDQYALFGEAGYRFLEKWRASLSMRLSYEEKFGTVRSTATLGGNPFAPLTFDFPADDDYVKPNPGGSISYDWTEDIMSYVRIATAYKSGGFNFRQVPSPDDISFDPEDAVNYELGVRMTLIDGLLFLNPTIFRLNQSNLQVRREVIVDGTAFSFFDNVGNGRTNGAELQLLALPHPDVNVALGYGFLDAEFSSASDTQFGDVTGNRIPFIPENTISFTAEYRPRLPELIRGLPMMHAFVRADVYATIGGFQDPQNEIPMDDRQLLNLQAGIETYPFRLRMFVENATDQTYYVLVPPTENDVGMLNAPRTFGVAVDYRFG